MSDVFSMWAVYDHPEDYPGHFIARRWEIAAGEAFATVDFRLGTTIDEVREALPEGLSRMPRLEGDAPVIVETWL